LHKKQTIIIFASTNVSFVKSSNCEVMKLAAMPSCLGGEDYGINVA